MAVKNVAGNAIRINSEFQFSIGDAAKSVFDTIDDMYEVSILYWRCRHDKDGRRHVYVAEDNVSILYWRCRSARTRPARVRRCFNSLLEMQQHSGSSQGA